MKSNQDIKMDYCPDCGAEIVEKANFCQECGQKIEYHPIEEINEEKKTGLWGRYKNKIQETENKLTDRLLDENTKVMLAEKDAFKNLSKADKAQYVLEEGIESKIKLPDYELRGRSGKTKAVATLAGGIPGYALAGGSKSSRRQIKTIFRMAEKGIVIEKGETSGMDLRIPWEHVYDVHNKGNKLILELSDGREIEVKISSQLINKVGSRNPAKYIAFAIQPKCQGVKKDDGW